MAEYEIVRRLRAPVYWLSVNDEYFDSDNDAPLEAADAIEALAAALEEVERWWLVEGKHVFLGAPHAIFAARAALAKLTGETP